MKRLIQFIKEGYEEFIIKDLHVEYDVFNINNKSMLCFHVPDSYSESDFGIYMQDMFLNDLPTGEDQAEEKFGDNKDNINDAYFTYDKFEKTTDKPEDFIEWDNKLDTGHNPDKEDFCYITITNIKYIIEFSEFKLKDDSEIDLKNTINTMFKAYESSKENEYPLNIVYNEKNTTYKEN